MNGSFGVFCGTDLVSGEFGNDDDADRFMRDLVEVGTYDAADLAVRLICEDYDVWQRTLSGLKASQRADREVDDAAA